MSRDVSYAYKLKAVANTHFLFHCGEHIINSSIGFLNSGSDVRNGACLEPRAIAKAPEGQGCPRCGGYVYAAEQMLARGRVSLPYSIQFMLFYYNCR